MTVAPAPAPAPVDRDPITPDRPRVLDRIDAMPTWIGGVFGILVVLVLWWIASLTLFTRSGAIPSPGSVFALFFDGAVWRSTWNNIEGTLGSAGLSYLWGNLLALIMAAVVILLPMTENIVNQLAIVTYCLPPVAIGPIIIIVAGREAPQAASITLAALGVFFTTVVGALLGLRAASRTTLDVVTAYGGSRLTALRKVRLIAALPNLMNALKIAAPAAFLGAVLAEYLGAGGESTLGKALLAAQFNADAPRLWYLALISGGVAGLAYFLIGLLGRLLTPWSSGVEAGTR